MRLLPSLLHLLWLFKFSSFLAYGWKSEGSACSRQSTVCLNATYVADSLTYELQVTDSVGWMALGFGRQMIGTHMVIMWENGHGTTLSQRYAKGYREPEPVDVPPWVAVVVQSTQMTRPAGSTTFAFDISVNETYFNASFATHNIIWAYSRHKPSSSDPSATLQYHDARGLFDLNMKLVLAEQGPPPDEDGGSSAPLNNYERLIVLHALFMSFGFLVLLPTGVVLARYARTFTTRWFKIHRMCNMYVALPVMILGFVLAIATQLDRGLLWPDVHQLCGLILLAIYLMQVGLGVYIHRRRSTGTSTHPIRNIVHIIFGLVIIGCAVFQVKGGMHEWEVKTSRSVSQKWIKIWGVWSLALPFIYIGGLVLLPRQFEQENKGLQSSPQYISLSDGTGLGRIVSSAEDDGLLERDGE